MAFTKEEIRAALDTIRAIADAIKEAGQIHAGTLYALLMPSGCTLKHFEQIKGILTRSELIREEGNLLIWNLKN